MFECKYFIPDDPYWTNSLGTCSITLPPWLKIEDNYKTVYPDDYCNLGEERD